MLVQFTRYFNDLVTVMMLIIYTQIIYVFFLLSIAAVTK